MAQKEIKSPVTRKIFTTVLFIGISGAFMGFYYFIYLPQQQAEFNKRMFRILHEIVDNFKTRAEGYGMVAGNVYRNRRYGDEGINFKTSFAGKPNEKSFNESFKSSFNKKNALSAKISSDQIFIHDSVSYKIKDSIVLVDSSKKALSEILKPLISIHLNVFESVLLVKTASDSSKAANGKKFDAILYKSPGLDIANINTDSLFPDKSLQAAAVNEINIEGIKYKMFLMPFQMNVAPNQTFILTGITQKNNYNSQSQNVPLDFLLTVVFILVLLLLCLPFIKVFILSVHENITITDVRFIIASIFIIPFFIILSSSSAAIYQYSDNFTKQVLLSLQNEIEMNFYKEIQQSINQVKAYDSILSDPFRKLRQTYASGDSILNGDSLKAYLRNKHIDSTKNIDSIDVKDLAFYPQYYRNIESLHWMESTGIDIASWRLTKDTASYFNLKDRQYFKDIKYKLGYLHPVSKDTFTLQATISKITGEYTLNIVVPDSARIMSGKKSIAAGISAKMYSVYNTIVPEGFSYCLVDQSGLIIFHSDTARSLQENLLEETDNNHSLEIAISHNDSRVIDNVQLYDEQVKMMVRPLKILPYYLVTYCNKRGEYLFIFHIAAFVFLCMSLLLVLVSLFSYCIMMTDKRNTKLLFIPGVFYWLKPSGTRKDYYIRNCIQVIASMILIFLFSVFLSAELQQLYMLNYALLLPLFAVTGYYIIKRSKKIIDIHKSDNQQKMFLIGKEQILPFLYQIKNILLLYIALFTVFEIMQNALFYNNLYSDSHAVKLRIRMLIVLLPIVMVLIAAINVDYIRNAIKGFAGKTHLSALTKWINGFKTHYLTPYLLSLMLSVLAISVIPAITLTRYALNEERKLSFQTFEIGLAKRIQERRSSINPRLWQTKLDLFPDTAQRFTDSLKFNSEKGLYLGGLSLDTSSAFFDRLSLNSNSSGYYKDTCIVACSPFYKTLTQFLFLPPDHDEFYDNVNNRAFYYWRETRHKKIADVVNNQKTNLPENTNTASLNDIQSHSAADEEADSLHLYYANSNYTDHKNPASIILSGELPDYHFLKDVTGNPAVFLILLIVLVVIFLFYKIISALAKRVFVIDYFDDRKTHDLHNTDWLRQKYDYYADGDDLYKSSCFASVPKSFSEVRKRENELLNERDDECILKIQLLLTPAYESIWKDCTDAEKITLFDFALDGYTNYKKVFTLLQLYQKGLLIKEDDNFHLMTSSFRNFVLTKENSDEIKVLIKQGKGSWAAARTVFYIILLVVAVFIFLSQEEASKRLLAIVTSLGVLLPAILKLFDRSTLSTGTDKNG